MFEWRVRVRVCLERVLEYLYLHKLKNYDFFDKRTLHLENHKLMKCSIFMYFRQHLVIGMRSMMGQWATTHPPPPPTFWPVLQIAGCWNLPKNLRMCWLRMSILGTFFKKYGMPCPYHTHPFLLVVKLTGKNWEVILASMLISNEETHTNRYKKNITHILVNPSFIHCIGYCYVFHALH